jgi:uncharacterized membrane protein HdeD (DUF308 family)
MASKSERRSGLINVVLGLFLLVVGVAISPKANVLATIAFAGVGLVLLLGGVAQLRHASRPD